MDDHFDTSGVFEISKFDISKFACTSSDLYTDTTTICDQCMVRKLTTHIKHLSILGVFLLYGGLGVSCVQAVANSPLAMWHAGVELNIGWIT